MSSGKALSQTFDSSFGLAQLGFFSRLPTFQAPVSPQRVKVKRFRQRVDAGEPRNSYQASKSPMLQQHFASGCQMNTNNSSNNNSNSNSNTENSNTLAAIFPWVTQAGLDNNLDQEITKEQSSDAQDITNLSSNKLNNAECNESMNVENDCTVNDADNEDGIDAIQADNELEKLDQLSGDEDAPTVSSPVFVAGSSSRRKSALPQKQFVDDDDPNVQDSECNDCPNDDTESKQQLKESESNSLTTPLAAANLTPQNKLQEMLEMHRKLCSNLIDQHKKILVNSDEESRTTILNPLLQAAPDFNKLKQSLKRRLESVIDEVINEFGVEEATSRAQKLTAAAATIDREQNMGRNPFMFHPLYLPFNGQSPFLNPFMQNPVPPTGIFPATAPSNNFNPFLPQLRPPSPTAGSVHKNDDQSSFGTRKKRSKVTDCSRLNKVTVNGGNRDGSLPGSARSTPQVSLSELSSYFPPTMVNNSLYVNGAFGSEERDSSANSDDTSDGAPYDGTVETSTTLTPMHLRKAKLMFFYTRYPSSALLKSYFPDIRFNKHNTAQLVKWFSNFREFFYNQMDKYARNYIAEGVKNKEDIIVTPESEIYKNLNQHYNRNNHIQPPERLVKVIQETLREFFVAVQNGRDAEPSWKKTIYKVITRMDDSIPEYFKDPNFLERLET